MLKETFTSTSKVIELDEPSRGLTFQGLKNTCTIRVDRVSRISGDINVFPELTYGTYLDMFAQLVPNFPIFNVSTASGMITAGLLPFAVGGAVYLDDDTQYRVTIKGNQSGNEVKVFSLDAPTLSAPVRVQRDEVKGTLSEKLINTKGVEAIYFSTDAPQKIEYQVAHKGGLRKVSLGYDAMWEILGTRRPFKTNDGTVDVANDYLAISTHAQNALNIHTLGDGNDFVFYKVDYL